MGSRKISLDPAASTFGLVGSRVMKVSLCGPHSFETSTFPTTLADMVAPAGESEPFLERYWNLSHHVGALRLFELWAPAVAQKPSRIVATSVTSRCVWLMGFSFESEVRIVTHSAGPSRHSDEKRIHQRRQL